VPNSAPVIVLNGGDTVAATLVENSTGWTAAGVFHFTDADTTDTHSVTKQLVPEASSGSTARGLLTVTLGADSTGGGEGQVNWSYNWLSANREFLAQNQIYTETYNVKVNDLHGGLTSQFVVFTLIGTNDAPVLALGPGDAAAAARVLQIDQPAVETAGGTVSFSDPDHADTHSLSFVYDADGSTLAAPIGTFSIQLDQDTANGTGGRFSWSYTIDSAFAGGLADYEKAVESFLVTVSDGHGGTATQRVSITLSPNHELELASGCDSAQIDAQAAGAEATIAFEDYNPGDAPGVSVTAIAQPGGGTLSAVVETDAPTPETDKPLLLIVAGQSNAIGSGATGLPTPAHLAGPLPGVQLFTMNQGFLTYQAGTRNSSIATTQNGSFGPEAEFAYQYRLAHPNQTIYIVKHAVGGSQLENTDIVQASGNSSDWAPQSDELFDLTTTVIDAAKVALSQLNVTDYNQAVLWVQGETDAGNAQTAASYEHNLANLIDAARDDWTDSDSPFIVARIKAPLQDFNATVKAAEVAVGDADPHGTWIDTDTFPLNADNVHFSPDGLVEMGATMYSAWHTVETSTGDREGTVRWTYTADPDQTRALLPGQSVQDSFTLTLDDGRGGQTERTITITIDGVNDAPVSGDPVDSDFEDNDTPIAGNLLVTASDPDPGDTIALAEVAGAAGNIGQTLVSAYGQYVIFSDGAYTYHVDNSQTAVQMLGQGQSAQDVIAYTLADNHGAQALASLVITIDGANDGPVAVADDVLLSDIDTMPVTGSVLTNDSDIDAGDVLAVSAVAGAPENVGVTVAGLWGDLLLNADGSYSYSLHTTLDALALGQSLDDVFAYAIADLQGSTATAALTVTIAGTNAAPQVVADTLAIDLAVQPDGAGNALANDSDVDAGAVLAVTLARAAGGSDNPVAAPDTPVAGAHGTLLLSSDGTYTYTADSGDAALRALRATETLDDVFTLTVADEHGASISADLTVTITGRNDAPDAVADTAGLTDVDTLPATGNVLVNDTDVDPGDILSVAAVGGNPGAVGQSVTGAWGDLLMNADGSYSYLLHTAAAGIAQGAVTDDVFTYTAADGQGGETETTLTISITGTNAAPQVVADTLAIDLAVQPDGTGDALANDSDVDAGAVLAVTLARAAGGSDNPVAAPDTPVAGAHGTLLLSPDGTYTYTADSGDAALRALHATETLDDAFTLTIADEHGASVSADLTITITGRNDAPAVDLGGPDDGAGVIDWTGAFVNGAGAVVIAGLGTIADPDTGDRLAEMTVSLTQAYDGAFETLALSPVAQNLLTLNGLSLQVVNARKFIVSGLADAGVYRAILDGATYTNTDNSFTLDMHDRLITIAIKDENGTASPIATATLRAQANVSDGTGFNQFTGGQLDDVINGLSGNDIIHGGGGADVIAGGSGNGNQLFGDAGDDIFLFGPADGFSTVHGGTDSDLIKAVADNTHIRLTALADIEAISADGHAGVIIEGSGFANTLDFTTVVLTGIEEIRGGGGADTITGSAGADVINGGFAADTLAGGDGDDIFLYNPGEGVDSFDGGAGFDTLVATASDLKIGISALSSVERIDSNGHGNVWLIGSSAANVLDFSSVELIGIVRIDGAGDNDTITGTANADSLIGNGGNDTLHGNGGNDTLNGGPGDDTIHGDAGLDYIIGGAGQDTLHGGSERDRFVFQVTNDSLPAAPDAIMDFETGIDRIDLSQIDADPVLADDQAFIFIGTAAFSAIHGQLRLETGIAGHTFIEADRTGDGVADLVIDLVGGAIPNLSDYFL